MPSSRRRVRRRRCSAALRLVRGLGTVSVVGAHFEPDFPLDNGLLFEKEMTLRVTWGHGFDDRERILGMLATGAIDPTPADHPPLPRSPRPRRPTASSMPARPSRCCSDP